MEEILPTNVDCVHEETSSEMKNTSVLDEKNEIVKDSLKKLVELAEHPNVNEVKSILDYGEYGTFEVSIKRKGK